VEKNQESQLIEQLRNGSKEAFRKLFDAYGPKIHAFAFSYLKNSDDADEHLQDVFLKLWEKRAELDTSKNIKSYLFKICINLIYDCFRRKSIEQAYLKRSVKTNSEFGDNTWQQVVYDDMQKNLQQLILGMPEQRQRIFRLSKEDGLTNEEISNQLHLSKRTVENQLYRAVSYLKNKLEPGSVPVLLFLFRNCF